MINWFSYAVDNSFSIFVLLVNNPISLWLQFQESKKRISIYILRKPHFEFLSSFLKKNSKCKFTVELIVVNIEN